MIPVSLMVLAKVPRPGQVKTRLTPPYTPAEAAELAAAALTDTLDAAAGADVTHRMLVLDSDDAYWRRPGFDLMLQRGGGLDERLTHAYVDAWSRVEQPMLLIGMDTPQVTAAELSDAAAVLSTATGTLGVLGRADDGGFWVLGLRRPLQNGLFGVPMSTSGTADATFDRLLSDGLSVHMLGTKTDVDDASSAALVAGIAPSTAFARTHARLGDCARTA